MLRRVRAFFRRRRYVPGARLREFLAPDVVREVEVVDASELDAGVVTVRMRTRNVLYEINGLDQEPAFSEPRRVEIKALWQWSGQPWGGPVPSDDPMHDKSDA